MPKRSPTRTSAIAAVTFSLVLAACGSEATVSPVSSAVQPSGGTSTAPSARPEASASETPTEVGPSEIGQVIADEPLVLRSAPGTGSDSTVLDARLHPGMRFSILEGPVAASGYSWYRVRLGESEGWAAAGTRDGEPYEPWLARVENGAIAIGSEPPDGSQLPQIYLIQPDGTVTRITSLAEADVAAVEIPFANVTVLTCGIAVHQMAWSPDGLSLAFVFGACDGNIFVVGVDGEPMRRLGSGRSATWSPDGGSLSFSLNYPYQGCLDAGCEPGPWELQVLAVADGSATAVTHSDRFVTTSSPAWSPDGRRIAFVAALVGVDSADEDTWIVDLATGRERAVGLGRQPRWSPDGGRLVVQRIVDTDAGDPGCGDCEGALWSVAVDGSDEVLIGSGYDGEWSPGGDRFAYWRDSFQPEVVVARADGSHAQVLDTPGRFAGWSPDGREVLISNEDGLWRYPLSSGEAHSVIDAPIGSAAWQHVLEPLTRIGL